MSAADSDAWYSDGLRFTCTQCGNCCTGAPGYVYVTRKEIATIAHFLAGREGENGPASESTWLGKKHLRRVGTRFSLTEDNSNGDCCFLKRENGKRICSIYPVRPLQCRTWPFWDISLESREEWNRTATNCPGMNHGEHYDFVQIEIRRTARCTEELPT